MSISQEKVKQIATLAHIELTAEELTKYGSQLDSILTYVNQLRKVNTNQALVGLEVNELVNVWRPDDIREWPDDEIKIALEQGEIKAKQFKVKKIL